MSVEELKDWAFERARDNGYVIVTERSKTRGEGVSSRIVKIWFRCDRGGQTKSVATVRRSGTKKINCPFKMIAKLDPKRGAWTLEVKNDQHNHGPAQHMEGHPFARRLSQDEEHSVETLYFQNM